jgi:tetratricopeptide (TPR) repeat protein
VAPETDLMAERQLTFRENEAIQVLNKVYLNFREGEFKEAAARLEQALTVDFESVDISNALKCANFWLEREERQAGISGDYERGEYYLAQWRVFSGFISRMESLSERCLFTIKYYVFGRALEHYQAVGAGGDPADAEILFRIGRCHKCRGNYESAISCLEQASQQKRDAAAILAELADCYSLVNESRFAKVFFREAFFLDPEGIELSFLESPMIQRLMTKLRSRFADAEIPEWLPVYGSIYGLFNVKRELRPLELGKLKQAIYQLEKDVESKPRLVPRLINHYFWLIDHYQTSGEDRQRIDEILAKLKGLNPEVYREYTN